MIGDWPCIWPDGDCQGYEQFDKLTMKIPAISPDLIEGLRARFFAKDRSIYLAANCFFYLNNGAYLSNAFIAETSLTSSIASVTFSNIPQGFRHLILITQMRSDQATENENLALRFNNDSSATYDLQSLIGNSATPSSGAARAGTSLLIGGGDGANARANSFAPSLSFIFGYSRSDIEKRTLSFTSFFGDLSADADMFAIFRAGGWRNKNVVTSIVLFPNIGPNFVSGSRFQLYGIL